MVNNDNPSGCIMLIWQGFNAIWMIWYNVMLIWYIHGMVIYEYNGGMRWLDNDYNMI